MKKPAHSTTLLISAYKRSKFIINPLASGKFLPGVLIPLSHPLFHNLYPISGWLRL
jgi:hypothetical protein